MSINSLREQILSLYQSQEWQKMAEYMDAAEDLVSSDADVACAMGLAASTVGRSPFNADTLSNAVRCLEAALALGGEWSEIVWPLVGTHYDLGNMPRVTEVLSHYLGVTSDPNERLRAAELLCQTQDVIGDYLAGVQAHQLSLTGLGLEASPLTRLHSYTNPHVAHAYGAAGLLAQWQQEAMACWNAVGEPQRTLGEVVALIRGFDACTSVTNNVDYKAVVRLCECVISQSSAKHHPQDIDTLSALCDMQTDMIGLYHRAGSMTKARASLDASTALIGDMRDIAKSSEEHQKSVEFAVFCRLHNLGYQCREVGLHDEALQHFLSALDFPFAQNQGPTCFFIAALMLEAGDKECSLAYLRRSQLDIAWSYDGTCDSLRMAFMRDRAFQNVRNDSDFLAAIR